MFDASTLTPLCEAKSRQWETIWFIKVPELLVIVILATTKHISVFLPNRLINYRHIHDKTRGFIQFSRTCIKFFSWSACKVIQHCRKHVGQQDLGTHDKTPRKPSSTPSKFTSHLQRHSLHSPKTATFLEKPVCMSPNQPYGLWINARIGISTARLHLFLLSYTLISGKVYKVNWMAGAWSTAPGGRT